MSRFYLIVFFGAGLLLFACSPGILTAPQASATPAIQPPATLLPVQPSLLPLEPPAASDTAAPALPSETVTPVQASQLQDSGTVTVFPDPAGYQWAQVLSGLSRPLFVSGAGDGSERLFIVSQAGQIFIAGDGQILAQPFLDISDRTTRPNEGGSYGERGLLGLVFHPDYAHNGYFFVNYTDQNGDTHISRFSVREDDPDRADPHSEMQLVFVSQPYPNHNGGSLAFGPDGFLYIGLGDGGSGGDPLGNGQSLQTLLGKILRLDINQTPYAIPADNPFAGGGGLAEIWAYGLRNPWRIAFDRLNGDLYIADVGQNAYEEVNIQLAGSPGGINYGWNFREATHGFEGSPPGNLVLIDPIAEYSHELGCSVTGGVVYRGAALLKWQGVYVYGDYCSGRIWGLLRNSDGNWQNEQLFDSGFTLTSFGVDDAGEIYVLDYGGGTLYRLEQK